MSPLSTSDLQLLNNSKVNINIQNNCGMIVFQNREFKVRLLTDKQPTLFSEEQLRMTAQKTAIMLLKKQVLQTETTHLLHCTIDRFGIKKTNQEMIQHEDTVAEKNTRSDYDSLISFLYSSPQMTVKKEDDSIDADWDEDQGPSSDWDELDLIDTPIKMDDSIKKDVEKPVAEPQQQKEEPKKKKKKNPFDPLAPIPIIVTEQGKKTPTIEINFHPHNPSLSPPSSPKKKGKTSLLSWIGETLEDYL